MFRPYHRSPQMIRADGMTQVGQQHMDDEQKHSEQVLASIEAMELRRNKVIETMKQLFTADGGKMFHADLYSAAAAKRVLSSTSAFKILVAQWNLLSARTLLRTHIDTALRYHAMWLVDEPHEFCLKILNGEQINQMKDRSGQKMQDWYLCDLPRL